MTITPSSSFRPVLTRNDDNNDVVFRCNDPDSGCLALTEDVSDVLCYCQQGGNLVPNNVPCVRGQSPYHQLPVIQLFICLSDVPVIFVILLVIGCIVLAAIIGLLCMCLCKSLVAMICIFFFSCFSNSRHPISEKENGHVEKQTAGGK